MSWFLVLSVLFSPALSLSWFDTFRDSIQVKASGGETFFRDCLSRSREARVVFEARICRANPHWFDSCASPVTIVQTLQGDPTTGSFRFSSDRIGDKLPAVSVEVNDEREAIERLQLIDRLNLAFVARDKKFDPKLARSYLGVRSLFRCSSSIARVWSNLSTIFTLGLVDAGQEDSGWEDFQLDESTR